MIATDRRRLTRTDKPKPLFDNQIDLNEPLIDKGQLAEKLGVTKRTIERMMAEDGLPYIQLRRTKHLHLVRFRYSEVVRWLEQRR